MFLQKLMKNLIVIIYVALITIISFFQLKTANNILETGANLKAPFVSIIVFIVSVAVIIAIFFILRAILISKNLSKNKIKIFEILYIVSVFIITRIIFGLLFLDIKVPMDELMLNKKDLILLDPFAKFVLLNIVESINKIFKFPELSVFMFNQTIFLVSTLLVRRLLRYTTKNNFFVNMGTFLYMFYPKFMYESLLINSEIFNNILILLVIYLIFKIIKEVKIVHGKSKKYLLLSVLLAVILSLITYTVSYTFFYILALIVINMFIKNIDTVHVKFSKKTLKKVTSSERAKLYKIEKVHIRKSTIAICMVVLTLICSKLVLDNTLTLVTKKNFNGYKPKEISSLFGTITEKYAREQMRDINFIVGDGTNTVNYNIGKTVIDILNLNKEGKLKEASDLSDSLQKIIEKPLSFKEKITNRTKKMVTIYTNDINNSQYLSSKVKNKNILAELMYMSNYMYKGIFVIVVFTEILHLILRRKRAEKTVIIKLVTVLLFGITYLYGAYHMTNITVTTLMIIIMFTNLLEIYKNRHGKIKALAEAKYNF